MRTKQVAAQLYTLRDHLKTPLEIAKTLRRVKAMGYPAVQVSGMGPIPEKELVKILDGEGLVCCATHEDSKSILAEPERIVDRLHQLNCTYTAYPWPADIKFEEPGAVAALAKALDHAGAVLRAAGQVLTYHNHDIEFKHKVGNQSALEFIYANTSPENLQGEPDTFWIKVGGDDPVAWCQKLRNRLPLLHMKDGKPGPEGKLVFAEIGSGILPWPEIIAESETSGCQWFIVEQDSGWLNDDPFASLETSLHFITTHLVR